MKSIHTVLYNFFIDRINVSKMGKMERLGANYIDTFRTYAGKAVMTQKELNEALADMLHSKQPFMAARFGATELLCASMFEFEINFRKEPAMKRLCNFSGFFPCDLELGCRFNDIIKQSCSNLDILGIWALRFEEYYIKKYANSNVRLTTLDSLDPWLFPEKPWSGALEGKKVLIIHPFSKSIIQQYSRRELIFPGTQILPEFELKTLKAVQTVAGEKDERFESWFHALEHMFKEAMQLDFEAAIIGCGAYGMPLASMIKEAGRQAIHLGGSTQILFGIKGKRWENPNRLNQPTRFFNDAWIRPEESERPKNFDSVEDGCYW